VAFTSNAIPSCNFSNLKILTVVQRNIHFDNPGVLFIGDKEVPGVPFIGDKEVPGVPTTETKAGLPVE
jgi:hypothetical protein